MIPELGQFALILALCLAVVQATIPLIGSLNGTPSWVAAARPLAYGQFVFLSLAFAALVHAFLNNDFSVLYVAQHGNTELPTIYKISAVWGAHEGSLLLWVLILSSWTVAVALFTRSLPEHDLLFLLVEADVDVGGGVQLLVEVETVRVLHEQLDLFRLQALGGQLTGGGPILLCQGGCVGGPLPLPLHAIQLGSQAFDFLSQIGDFVRHRYGLPLLRFLRPESGPGSYDSSWSV